jgi:hypothetical protein
MSAVIEAVSPRQTRAPWRVVVLAAVVVVALAVGWGAVRLASGPAEPAVPTSPAVESTWGVRMTSVNIGADGGLVDLRFVVLDSSKATALMAAKRDAAPRLAVDDDGGMKTFYPSMTVHRQMTVGRTYILLYRNTGGSIRSGHDLMILVGDLRIDRVVPG